MESNVFWILFFDVIKKILSIGIFFVTRYGCLVCKYNVLDNPQASQQRTARHTVKYHVCTSTLPDM